MGRSTGQYKQAGVDWRKTSNQQQKVNEISRYSGLISKFPKSHLKIDETKVQISKRCLKAIHKNLNICRTKLVTGVLAGRNTGQYKQASVDWRKNSKQQQKVNEISRYCGLISKFPKCHLKHYESKVQISKTISESYSQNLRQL